MNRSYARIQLGWLLVLLFVSGLSAAIEFPQLTGRVVDEANLLSPGARAQLTERLAQHERETSNQLVIVTLKSLQGYAIEDFGYQLGRQWGIGQEKRNNGVLLIVAPNERKVRIEVGYGLEGDLTDLQSHTIIQNAILPRFREGNFEAGIVEGTDAILGTLAGTYEPMAAEQQDNSAYDSVFAIGFFAFFFGQAFLSWIRPRVLGAGLLGVGAGGVIWLMFGITGLALTVGGALFLLHLLVRSTLPGGRTGGFGGGGRSGGSWGGGGGGFSGGGGSFGGGGSSGSW